MFFRIVLLTWCEVRKYLSRGLKLFIIDFLIVGEFRVRVNKSVPLSCSFLLIDFPDKALVLFFWLLAHICWMADSYSASSCCSRNRTAYSILSLPQCCLFASCSMYFS